MTMKYWNISQFNFCTHLVIYTTSIRLRTLPSLSIMLRTTIVYLQNIYHELYLLPGATHVNHRRRRKVTTRRIKRSSQMSASIKSDRWTRTPPSVNVMSVPELSRSSVKCLQLTKNDAIAITAPLACISGWCGFGWFVLWMLQFWMLQDGAACAVEHMERMAWCPHHSYTELATIQPSIT